MKFKREIQYLLLYFIVVLLISLLVGRQISISYFYENIYIFSLVIFIYLIIPVKYELIEYKLYRYSKKKDFKKSWFIEYSISNLSISIGLYIINIVCSMIFSRIQTIDLNSLYYPLHVFIIFEIVFLYEMMFLSENYSLIKSIIIYFIAYIMYFMQVLSSQQYTGIWNPFAGLFYIGDNMYFISYIVWLATALCLNYILSDMGDI